VSPSRPKKPDDKRPTEQTPKTGITVPIPKRGEFFANLKKLAGKEREHPEPDRRND
jgi:hypothetical protein